ncbi:MAG: hypothetical protein H0X63_06285 [Flavobacteriales bacterium]|nr:hypothetical protein [Flavobacteriales bacterium]
MKRNYLIILIVIGFSFSAFKQPKFDTSTSPKLFIGYINKQPVFDAYQEKTLYVLKEKLEILVKYPSNYIPKIVKDKFTCYEEKTKMGCNIVLSIDNTEKKYPLECRLSYIALDESGNLFYTDTKAGFLIKSIIGNQIKDLGVKGYVINIIDGYLFYSKEHDPNLNYANADIFVLDIKTSSTAKKILSNVSGESTVILPDRKYIYEQMLIKGKFKPILYSTEDNIYKELDIESEFLNSTPYYSYQKNALVFYDAETLKMKNIEISKVFNNIE